ncbi:MAG: TIGR02117 family protein [Chitinophagales bacterium]
MSLLKRFFKYLFLLSSPFLFYLIAAFVLAKIPTNPPKITPDSSESIQIFVLSSGIHTDFIVPIQTPSKNWRDLIHFNDFAAIDSNRVNYLSFGWGDEGFYLETPTWEDLKASTVLQAAFLPSPTIMHIDCWNSSPPISENCKSIDLQILQYEALISYIENSFQKDAKGNIQLIPNKGYYGSDNFYKAQGNYHLFNTCNNWTNQGLKQAQVKTAVWSPFVDGIMNQW